MSDSPGTPYLTTSRTSFGLQVKEVFLGSRQDFVASAGLVVAIVALFATITYHMISLGDNDYSFHIELAQSIPVRGNLGVPQFLFHIIVVAFASLVPPLGYPNAALVVTTLIYCATGLFLFALIRRAWGQLPSYRISILSAVLALTLLMVSPIFVLQFPPQNLYLGYVVSNVYHNPTILILKPFAIVLFFCALRIFDAKRVPTNLFIGLTGVLTALCTLAKPNFTISLLPALGFIALIWILIKQPIHWRLLIVGIGVPAVLTLLWQYNFAYNSGGEGVGGGIIFAPFAVFRMHDTLRWLPPKLVVSLLFPIGVYTLFFRTAHKSLALNFAWVLMVVNLLIGYLLAESGDRFPHANFIWGMQAAAFILFAVSLVFLIEQARSIHLRSAPRKQSFAFVFCSVVLVLHLFSGILWYATQFAARPQGWW